MRYARDTFLHFLSDNLGSAISVHNVRKDTNFPDAVHLTMNAVNVQFIADSPRVGLSDVMVTVDVVYDDELTAVGIASRLFLLLSASGYTPLTNYTNPATPVAIGSNLFWRQDLVKFRPVFGDTYYRSSALLTLTYHTNQAFTTQ